MKKSVNLLSLALSACVLISSCNNDKVTPDNPDKGTTGKTTYVISSLPVGSQGVADYLLTVDDLTQGSVTTVGKGKEQDGTYRYYVTHKNKFFSMLYGQINPGAVTTYKLNGNGELEKISDFQSETVQVFAPVKDDIFTIKVPRSGNPSASMFRINADESKIVGEAQVDIVQLAGNGERAHFTWAKQVGDKVFAPYMSIKGAAPDVFGTSYPDSSWIAVFSYPDLKLEKVIRDNRTSSIGAYFTDGLIVTENGDIYGYSPASAKNNGALASTKPSAIVRIKSGTTEFDQSYFFNVQEKSGGHHIYRQTYFGNGKILLEMYAEANKVEGSVKLAVADVNTQTFTWVTGMPDPANVASTSMNKVASQDGKTIYIGINTSNEGSYVYTIDAATATATRGLKVEGGNITAINSLVADAD